MSVAVFINGGRHRTQTRMMMKKKLKLFCLLIFVVLVCDILSMSNVFITGFTSGMRHGMEKRDVKQIDPSNYCYISLLPAEISSQTAQTITDKATGKSQQAWPTQLMVQKKEQTSTFSAIFKVVYTLVFGALAIAALVAFIYFVRNINRNKIFIHNNIRLLRIMGWCLLTAGIIVTADGCYDTYVAQQSFSLSGYVVDYSSAADLSNILFGLFSLVIAEAFAIGLKMKEEQELTI